MSGTQEKAAPWKVEEVFWSNNPNDPPDKPKQRYGWKVTGGIYLDNIHDEAHARLIAAAPELLEALEKVKAWFVKLEDGTEDDDPLRAIRKKYHAPVHSIMDAAIAKARGRQL